MDGSGSGGGGDVRRPAMVRTLWRLVDCADGAVLGTFATEADAQEGQARCPRRARVETIVVADPGVGVWSDLILWP